MHSCKDKCEDPKGAIKHWLDQIGSHPTIPWDNALLKVVDKDEEDENNVPHTVLRFLFLFFR